MTKEVLSRGNAFGDSERHLALVGDEGVDSPYASGGVVAVLVDLEPLETCHAGSGGSTRGNLGTVKQNNE